MVDALNPIVCSVLMVLLAPVAVTMRSDGHWPQRLAFIMVVVLLGLQIVSPMFDDWLPDPNGLQIAFNVVMLLVVLSARRQIMAVVRMTVGKPPEVKHQLRRAQDLSEAQLSRAHGKGVEQ